MSGLKIRCYKSTLVSVISVDVIVGEFGKKNILVSGGYANIEDIPGLIETLDEIDSKYGTISQVFDADFIAGKNHILQASRLALDSLERGRAFANDPSIELTCWTAGMRQINKSLDRVGVKEDSERIAIVTIGEDVEKVKKAQDDTVEEISMDLDDDVLDIDEEKEKNLTDAYSLSEDQLETHSIDELVIEKVALLSLEQ